jgi:CBS domain-containing protein
MNMSRKLSGIPGEAPTVADLMRKSVVSVRPDASVREVIGLLVRHGISGCPVMEEGGGVIGTVSVTDLLWLSDQLVPVAPGSSEWKGKARSILDGRTAGDIMTPDVFGIEPGESLAELSRFFSRTGLHRALVMEAGELVGIVSISDLLDLIAGEERPESLGQNR